MYTFFLSFFETCAASFLIVLLTVLLPGMKAQAAEQENIREFMDLLRIENPHVQDLPSMTKRKTVRVLTSFSRTNFYIEKGHTKGFEYSLLKEYEKYLNEQTKHDGLPIVLEFIPVPTDKLIPALIQGYGDIAAANLTITPERADKIQFTDPYLSDVSEIVIGHASAPAINALENLSRKKILVRKSSSYFSSLQTMNKTLEKQGLAPAEILEADETLGTEDILEIVNTGAVPYTVADSHIARHWLPALSQCRAYNQVPLIQNGRIAWMVRKTNPKLLADLNAFIAEHKKGTLLGNIFFKRYFAPISELKNPMGQEEQKRLEHYVKLFQKYGKQYGIDWKLVAAQAYQESGLDHTKRSPAGAVGIMQIMPSLAKDTRIGITDITSVENNIHAGVKYLALLRDLYYNDSNFSDQERIRFALAAYNAGPTNIRRARDTASDLGFNSWQWFRNTEYGAMKRISTEPVHYVSNINRYYIIYLLGDNIRTHKQSVLQPTDSE